MDVKLRTEDAARAAAEATRCIALRARRLSRLVTKLFEDALRDQEITVAQFTLLGAAILEGPLQPARLGRLLDLEKSTVSRNLRLLEAAGLLRIEGAPGGSGQRVKATDRGRHALLRAFPAWQAAQRQAVEAMGEVVVGRLDSLIAALRQVRVAARSSPPTPAPRGGARVTTDRSGMAMARPSGGGARPPRAAPRRPSDTIA